MENAVDALKIAASVLLFVVALSISINAFGEVRIVSQTLLDYTDREYEYTYVENNGTTKRIVGLESVIPTVSKAYKENYKIVFDSSVMPGGVYKKNNEEVYTIDLENETIAGNTAKEQFLLAIIYGKDCMKDQEMLDKFGTWEKLKETYKNSLKIYLNDQGIYDKINNVKLEESIGVYYQEEVGGTEEDSSVPDTNKTQKRVITYSRI